MKRNGEIFNPSPEARTRTPELATRPRKRKTPDQPLSAPNIDELKINAVLAELRSMTEPLGLTVEINPPAEPAPQVIRNPETGFRIIREKAEKKRKRKEPETPHVEFEKKEEEPVTFHEHIEWLKEKQARVERISRSSEYATIKIDSASPVAVVLSSDWHIGSGDTDYATFEKHMKMIKEEPNAFLVALSNTIDGYIWPGGMWSEVAHIPEQIEIAKSFAQEYKDKLLAVVGSRCHDWTKDKGGISPQETAFMENVDSGMPFFTNGGVLKIDLNGIPYDIAMIHKSRFHSSLNVTNPNKRVFDLRWPADVIAIAHHHVAAVEQTSRLEGPYKRDVVFVRTGTYKINDGYSKSEGFGAGQLGGTVLILDPAQKRITPFYRLEDGLGYLKALRELAQITQKSDIIKGGKQ